MGTIRARNTFEGGINTDASPERTPNNQLRDAVNVDVLGFGQYAKLENIKGTSEILQYLPNTVTALNILAAYAVEAQYDYNGDLQFEQNNNSIIVFTHDSTNGSAIYLIDLTNSLSHRLYPNATDTTSLDFPPLGSIDASYTKERGIPEIYWDDFQNELRKIQLRYSNAPTYSPPSIRELGVRKRLAGSAPILVDIDSNGFLLAGTYQIAYRLYSEETCNYSDWSYFTNPIAIAPADCSTLDTELGGKVNQVTDKSIIVSLPINPVEKPFYDSIQLAVLKNIDGLTIPSNIAYITLPNTDWYDNPTTVEYKGDTGNEVAFPIDDIVTEDASIQCAKTQVIKENRLFRGNIKYYEAENDRSGDRYESAETITQEVNYKCGEDTNRYKGYWRDECYAFAKAYYDEYNNVRLVEPFEFDTQNISAEAGLTTIITGSSNQGNGYYLITVTDTSNLTLGGLLRLPNGNTLLVCEIGVGFALVQGIVSGFIPATAQILKGESGNWSEAWSWKFAPRSARNYTILNNNSRPQALGLRINGVKNHPSWAKGFVIVRQERKKNILAQSPHIPTVAVRGVPTQGVGPVTWEFNNPQKLDFNLSDYTGDKDTERAQENLDTITPKIFGFGNAKNIAAKNVYFGFLGGDAVQYPYYANQIYDWEDVPFSADNTLNTPADDQLRGGEMPRYFLMSAPEYVYNRAGEPTYPLAFNGQEFIRAVDAVQLKRKILVGADPQMAIANVYQALDRLQYLYTSEGYIYRDFGLPTQYKDFSVPTLLIDGRAWENNINAVTNVTLASPFFLTDERPCVSRMFENVELYGAIQDLSAQQGQSNAVPNATASFFNLVSNQRLQLLRPQTAFADFTLWMYNGLYGGDDVQYFPNSSVVMPNTVFTVDQLMNNWLNSGSTHTGAKTGQIPVKNIFVANEDESVGGAWILNIYKGLPDDRYSKIATNWVFTGAQHEFTGTEVADNTPIDIDVWGGDCFVTKYAVKIVNNAQRISDPFTPMAAEADDYPVGFLKEYKTGSYNDCAEFLELFIESEVNTEYYVENDEYPAYKGDKIGNYTQPYFYQYNGSYSVNNVSKTFATVKEPCEDTNGSFPARIVYSDQRLYQADGSGFVDTDGFSKFRVLNFKDLEEQYGAITKIVDLGDQVINTLQQRKVRIDPIARDIIENADGTLQVVGSSEVFGQGGYYLPYDTGCQHIRTAKTTGGMIYFTDVEKRQLIMTGSQGSGWKDLSDNNVNGLFTEFLGGTILEKDLMGLINEQLDKNEYWLIKNGVGKDAVVYSNKTKSFKTRIDSKDILGGVYSHGNFYLLQGNKLFTMYTGNYGYMFDEFKNSMFEFVVNDYPSIQKIYNSLTLDMVGQLQVNVDQITGTVPNVGAISAQVAQMLTYTSYIKPQPLKFRNGMYWVNDIRNIDTAAKIRGNFMEVLVDIVNEANKYISISAIVSNSDASYRNP